MRCLFVIVIFLMFLSATSFAQPTNTSATISHNYITGIIEDFVKIDNSANIKVNGEVYLVNKDCIIIVQKKVKNSITEVKGNLSDIRKHQYVTIKVINRLAKEIIIEKWRM